MLSASTGLGGAECRHHGQSSCAATAGEVVRIQILRGQSTTRTACESPRRISEAKGGARKETPQSLRPTHMGSTAPQGPGVGCPCNAATQRRPGPRMRPLPQPPSHLPPATPAPLVLCKMTIANFKSKLPVLVFQQGRELRSNNLARGDKTDAWVNKVYTHTRDSSMEKFYYHMTLS